MSPQSDPRRLSPSDVSALHAAVYERVANLPQDASVDALPVMPHAGGVLVCPPDHYDIVDVKNPFMAGNVGAVDRAGARRQWDSLVAALRGAGGDVSTLPATPGCEDMVFCANTALFARTAGGDPLCVTGHMRFPSREPEVRAVIEWSEHRGITVLQHPEAGVCFEGSGDAIWHPGRRLLWGGYGWRTDPQVYPWLARTLGVPVIALPLTDSTFYHLDTCFSPVDERTVLVYPPAIAAEGMDLIRRVFERVVEVDASEAERFACNGAALHGTTVVMDQRAANTAAGLEAMGFRTTLVDTGEFLKSGGSVYCMKNTFWPD